MAIVPSSVRFAAACIACLAIGAGIGWLIVELLTQFNVICPSP